MKTTTALVAAFASLVAAQNFADSLPECASDCLADGVQSATDCSLDDGDCICEVDNYRNTYDASLICVLNSCGADTSLNEVLPAAAAFCSEVTGGATAPPVDESSSSTTAAPEPSTTEEAEPTTTTAEEEPSSTAAEETTAEEETSAAPSTTTAMPTPTVTPTGNGTSNSTTPTPTPTAGAGSLSYMGTLAMLALGAAAIF